LSARRAAPARAQVRLRVAGLTLHLRAARPDPLLDLPSNSRPFAATRGGDIVLDLQRSAAPEADPGRLLFDSGGVWRVHEQDDGLLYTFHTPALRPPLYRAVAIDRGLRRGTLYCPPVRGQAPRHALEFPLDELLFQHRLTREGALEVHACAVAGPGGALLFCGKSGAGKSTTARLWRRAQPRSLILSDDRVVLRLRGPRPWAYGTPWHGEARFAEPAARPLRAVFFLRHARENSLRPLPLAEAAARLLARSFPPPWDGAALARALETAHHVAAAVPCYDFGFRPDRSAVDAARRLLPPARRARRRSTSPTR
jgi:hypothetical protein